MEKNLPIMHETQVQSLGQEDPLGEGMETHSSFLAWRIPRTEEPGRLWSMGSQSDTTEVHQVRVRVQKGKQNRETVLMFKIRKICEDLGREWKARGEGKIGAPIGESSMSVERRVRTGTSKKGVEMRRMESRRE